MQNGGLQGYTQYRERRSKTPRGLEKKMYSILILKTQGAARAVRILQKGIDVSKRNVLRGRPWDITV